MTVRYLFTELVDIPVRAKPGDPTIAPSRNVPGILDLDEPTHSANRPGLDEPSLFLIYKRETSVGTVAVFKRPAHTAWAARGGARTSEPTAFLFGLLVPDEG